MKAPPPPNKKEHTTPLSTAAECFPAASINLFNPIFAVADDASATSFAGASTASKLPVESSGSCSSWDLTCFLEARPNTPSPLRSTNPAPLPPPPPSSSPLRRRRSCPRLSAPVGFKYQCAQFLSSDKKPCLTESEKRSAMRNPVRAKGVIRMLPFKIKAKPHKSFLSRSLSADHISDSDHSSDHISDDMNTNLIPGDYYDDDAGSSTGSTVYDSCISFVSTHARPFHDFVEEIKRSEIMAKLMAWKEARIVKLLNKLDTKEREISAWKVEKTAKAKAELHEMEKKMEEKRMKSLAKMKKTISELEMKADEKKMKQRDSTAKKISKLSSSIDQMSISGRLPWKFFFL